MDDAASFDDKTRADGPPPAASDSDCTMGARESDLAGSVRLDAEASRDLNLPIVGATATGEVPFGPADPEALTNADTSTAAPARRPCHRRL